MAGAYCRTRVELWLYWRVQTWGLHDAAQALLDALQAFWVLATRHGRLGVVAIERHLCFQLF
jgi:hypothetical protein